MGKELNLKRGKTVAKIDTGTGSGTSTGNGPESKSAGTAGTAGTGNGTGSGTGSGTGTGTGEKAKLPEVSILKIEEPKEQETKKPEPKDPAKKPKKTRKPKQKEPALPVEQLDALIVSLSGIVAARPNQAHWLISESEAHSVSVPLCNILERTEVLQKFGENSDAVALALAAFTIVMPRAMITVAQVKEKKKVERTGNTVDVNVKERPVKNDSTSLPKRDAEGGRGAGDSSNLLADLSFLGGDFFG